jgi:RecJ-like exonuclease
MESRGSQRAPENASDVAPGDEAPPDEPSSGENVCPECGGSGKVERSDCSNCEGTGRVNEAIGGG